MRILAIDYGERRLGMALSDELGIAAHGIDTVEVRSPGHAVKAISRAIAAHNPGKVVVGLPLNEDGSVGPRAQAVLDFCEVCRAKGKTPVETWDERFSTIRAQRAMYEGGLNARKQKKHRDRLSAVIILQDYLETHPTKLDQSDQTQDDGPQDEQTT